MLLSFFRPTSLEIYGILRHKHGLPNTREHCVGIDVDGRCSTYPVDLSKAFLSR